MVFYYWKAFLGNTDNNKNHTDRQTDRQNKKKQQYQVGRKWVQMLRVSLVSWKRLRMQSVAELRGCRYPEMMLSSWKTCRRRRRRTLRVGLKQRPRRCGLHQDCCFIPALVTNTVHYFKGFSPITTSLLDPLAARGS